jgi:hypothetical protein
MQLSSSSTQEQRVNDAGVFHGRNGPRGRADIGSNGRQHVGKDKVEDARESGAVSRSASAESGQGGAGGFGKCWAKVREEDQETGDLMSGSLIDKGREEGGRGGEGEWGIGMVGGVSLEATEQRALIAWIEEQRARAAAGCLARDRCPL